MTVVHTEAAAIFNSLLINEAEDQIQYVKYRPSQPFDSNTPINLLYLEILANTFPYMNLICLYKVM